MLGTITVPTLVVVGPRDMWSPVARQERIAGAIAGALLEVVEDSGQMVTLGRPAVVATMLVDWIGDRTSDGDGTEVLVLDC